MKATAGRACESDDSSAASCPRAAQLEVSSMKLPVALLLWFIGPVAWAQVTLISTGSVWKYLANGSDPGAAWRANAFDDASWPSGPAQLGWGDGDEATVLFAGNAAQSPITTYYRRSFF